MERNTTAIIVVMLIIGLGIGGGIGYYAAPAKVIEKPGETKTIQGKIYLFDGNKEDFLVKYERDFPSAFAK